MTDQPLSFLVGTWTGTGRGEYPTIEPFGYREELTITSDGRPFVSYEQRTWHADDGRPLHAESGFLRPDGSGGVEILLAHPIGMVEVGTGTLGDDSFHVTTSVSRTPTSKDVSALQRVVDVEGDILRYRIGMAAMGQPMTHHLEGELRRQS